MPYGSTLAPYTPAPSAGDTRLRVMIVDDAIVVRGLFARWIEAEPDMLLAASLRNGREAVDQIELVKPDVVVLDVDMPELDGISALPLLLAKCPGVTIIMASTLTRRNAEISLRALSLGATDYIPKPSSQNDIGVSADFRHDVIEKIRTLGRRGSRLPDVNAPPLSPGAPHPIYPAKQNRVPMALRPMPALPPRVLLIGASTGGPQALNKLVVEIGIVIERVPVLITQHMPPTFTGILAEHLGRLAKVPAREAIHGEEIVPGTIYMAPGGRHMSVAQQGAVPVIEISNTAPINFCKPAVDPLFSTAANVWGPRAMALMLTGMGHDGLAGAHDIVNAGGHVMAQDEASSVVWGMPGQVALAGLCCAVLPLTDMGAKLSRLFAAERA